MRLGAKINLVICQKSKVNDWIQHFETHYPNTITHDCARWKKLDWNKLLKLVEDAETHALPHVYVLNYELAWRRPELLKLRDFTLLLDESSLIQNRKAKQTKFILKLEPKNVILLSGTPTSGKYENLWTQMHLLGWDISESTYQKQYINWKKIYVPGGQMVRVVDKDNPYKNVERLKEKMREHGSQFMKTEEVMNLPEQNFIEIKISKIKEYNTFMKTSYVTLEDGSELVGDTYLTKRLYARMLCGQHNENKLAAFRDLLMSTNDRLVVFYNFNAELEALIETVPDGRPVSIINGNRKDLDAYEHHDDSITFVQYQAGAMGLNLQKANKVIYFTLPERSELFEQSKKRIHRINQTKPCYYYIMMCNGTIDEDVYSALKQRKDYTDELFRMAKIQ